ncbi:hypothetical protein H6F77_07495 [Microcoleus sp. FACHB-831]|uniref:hypothetical protein n=1 Tax=Microcoleus sp. FACHB-831 TaxID=2692827 RepID=UPI001683B4BB|nr:hypothetical protein [Microcoleus sp. FACHB-831]MBD1920930.1 hypothetical protein [Microcoleus sp. FACHB-831]
MSETPATDLDAKFKDQVQKLYGLTVWGRWFVVGILWISVGSLSLWSLRYHISLLLEYFTWAAVRYSLIFNTLPTLGLSLCIGMTVAVLVWQIRNSMLGLPAEEQRRLEQQVQRIRQQGPSHPLWKLVCKS